MTQIWKHIAPDSTKSSSCRRFIEKSSRSASAKYRKNSSRTICSSSAFCYTLFLPVIPGENRFSGNLECRCYLIVLVLRLDRNHQLPTEQLTVPHIHQSGVVIRARLVMGRIRSDQLAASCRYYSRFRALITSNKMTRPILPAGHLHFQRFIFHGVIGDFGLANHEVLALSYGIFL